MKDKMNVMMVGSALSVKGGMTTVVKNFINTKFDDINIIYIPTHVECNGLIKILYFGISIFRVLFSLMFKNISIVHMHVSERGSFTRKYIIYKISKRFNKKVFIHMHGAEFKEYFENCSYKKKIKIKQMLIKADKVIVLGKSWNDYIKKIDDRIKTIIISNSVEYVKKIPLRKDLNINILFLAVIIERKGIYDLINAAKEVISDESLQKYNIKFIVAGCGSEEEKVKNLVSNIKLNSNFEFTGWVNDMKKKELLEKSHIFVLPSYNEGLPMSILEAMSYGLPIIATNVGSVEDAVINNYNGIIINPGNVMQLKESIKKCIIDKKNWDKFSKNSKYLIETKYNNEIYFKRFEEIYNKEGKKHE